MLFINDTFTQGDQVVRQKVSQKGVPKGGE